MSKVVKLRQLPREDANHDCHSIYRVSAELQKAQQNAARYEAKLSNENFTSRAPEAVVNAEREKFEMAKALCAQLAEAEARLKAL